MTFKSSSPTLLSISEAWYSSHSTPTLNVFALVDAAQDKVLWQRLTALAEHLPILASGADDLSPHLIHLGKAGALSETLRHALARPFKSTALSVLYTSLRLSRLRARLHQFASVALSGNLTMGLAFWDPAILGTLVGQGDDNTLHVKGPVLSEIQRNALLRDIVAWWYLDREENSHQIESSPATETDIPEISPLTLDQEQEDALVEASVPDQVLYHVETNTPTLFDANLPHARRYRFIRAVLPSARQLGLTGMRDMTNFVALCLIYRQRMESDPQILHLLNEVQKKAITLDQAMRKMPE